MKYFIFMTLCCALTGCTIAYVDMQREAEDAVEVTSPAAIPAAVTEI